MENEIIAALLGMTEDEVAETIKSDGGKEILLEKGKAKIAARFDDGWKASDKKKKKEIEEVFRAAGVEDPSYDNIRETVERAQTVATEKTSTQTGKDIPDEELLKKPAVVRALNEIKLNQQKLIDDARKQERETLKAQREAFEKQQVEVKIRGLAEKQVDALNPVFDEDPARAARQRKRLVDDIVNQGTYKLENDTPVLVDTDGNVLVDDMGNPKQFEGIVRQVTTDYYKLPAAKKRESAGLTQDDVRQPPTDYKGPKTQEEYQDQLSKLDTPQQRQELTKTWEGRPQPQAD